MASSLTATIMAATMNSPTLLLSLSFSLFFFSSPVSFSLSRFLTTISSFYPKALTLFFSLSLRERREISPFFSAASTCTHTHVRARSLPRTRNILSHLLAVLSPLLRRSPPPYDLPRPPSGLSLSFQQWRLHKSRYNVEMDQREWPRPTRGTRLCVCIVAYAMHTRCAHACVRG